MKALRSALKDPWVGFFILVLIISTYFQLIRQNKREEEWDKKVADIEWQRHKDQEIIDDLIKQIGECRRNK